MALLATFSVDDLVSLSAELRELAAEARSMEEAATLVVEHLYRCLTDQRGEPAAALVRFYVTHAFGTLPADLQAFARRAAGEPVSDQTRCLTLLGTTGVRPEWRDRHLSQGHQAIPLTSEAAVAAMPMVSRLINELGLELSDVVSPPADDLVLSLHHRNYNVFHVKEAAGSPSIPDQEFVATHGVRSALGIGSVLPSGDLCSVVMFSTVPVNERVADLFTSLAPAVKAAVVRFSYNVFA